MSERLVIKNFGPIKHVDLEIKKVNVLIGDQGTGKSTVAKVLAICRDFNYINSRLYSGLFSWGLDDFFREDSSIEYYSNHYEIYSKINYTKVIVDNGDHKGDQLENRYSINSSLRNKSKEFETILEDYQKIISVDSNGIPTVPYSFYQNFENYITDNPIYIDTDRGLQSIFSLGKNSIQNLSDAKFNQFAKLDQINRAFTNEVEIEPIKIKYKNNNGQGFFSHKNENRFYKLSTGASGFQHATPIVLAFKYYNEIKKKNKKTFIIEEPEISLFPTTQYELVKFFTEQINQYNNTIFLPTHSPYILTSLNNLMQAFVVGENNTEKVNEIIEEKYWLNPNDVSAYMLTTDGLAENIIAEDGLIMTEKIDSVSDVLNGLYDRLLDIKYSNN